MVSTREVVNSGIRREDMIEVTYRGGKVVGYFASIHDRRLGLYTNPLDVESFESFPLNKISVRRC